MKKVLIISNHSGGGHCQTAQILSQTLSEHGWDPEIISVYRDLFPDYSQIFGVAGEEIYNKLVLTKEMTPLFYRVFFMATYYLVIQPNRRNFAKRLANFWQRKQPDLVISVIPLLNQIIAHSLTRINKRVPFAIIQTDLFEFHEAFWLTPIGTWFVADDQTYTIVGTDEAYQQVLSLFIPDRSRVFKLSGNIIDPRFLAKPEVDRDGERQKLGLAPQQPVGLFLYGGYAPNRLLNIATGLNRLEHNTQFIFICGRNADLRQRLSSLKTQYKKVVVGYTSDMPYYMHLSDFLIGKSGPGSIMEGIAANLPLLIDTSRVLIHESKNFSWVAGQGFGLEFKNVDQLLSQIHQLTSCEVYDQLKANVSCFENRAVLEIPGIVDTIMAHFYGS